MANYDQPSLFSEQEPQPLEVSEGAPTANAEVIDLSQARYTRELTDSRDSYSGFSYESAIPDVDMTDTVSDKPLGTFAAEKAERGRHPTAHIVLPPEGEDPNDPVIKEWMERRARALALGRIPTKRLSIAQQNENERQAILKHQRNTTRQVHDPAEYIRE